MAVQQAEAKPKHLRVKVVDHLKEGAPAVNVNIPVGVAKFGLRMAQSFSPEMKNANVDWSAIEAMLDEGLTGELVHVEDEAQHKTVDVWLE
jgi:hypothetical protein